MATALILGLRCCILACIAVGMLLAEHLQNAVNETWAWLLQQWWFNSVYFETVWAPVCFTVLLVPMYRLIDSIPLFDRYKIDKKHRFIPFTALEMLKTGVFYMAPLALLDTFMVKHYKGCGIDPMVWKIKRQTWVQTTRALPAEPPSVALIPIHIVCALVVFDMFFFLVHYSLHKNAWLYKTFHALHHDHATVDIHVTNQLTVVERIVLILSANEGLKIVNSHPLTRAIYVPIFLWLLMENHCVYDWPWGLDKLVPFGLMGGPARHFAHHVQGSGNYAPFFTYLDKLVKRTNGHSRKIGS
ncbi:cholesterol 25-hydroxylase-like [Lingula anatina]|uniref:Cholesterol 25-hydroxylase-like n=1 Tax=Lingula anatina TaxID=7574 RepID=A0A1S3K2C7_LINAN|nr:cholesterol 25-hydroxylase-like [Lingula anatina]|eukprot:XP_013416672.1 cholesterol 25-hydroxylase-like [Lingula anatina]